MTLGKVLSTSLAGYSTEYIHIMTPATVMGYICTKKETDCKKTDTDSWIQYRPYSSPRPATWSVSHSLPDLHI